MSSLLLTGMLGREALFLTKEHLYLTVALSEPFKRYIRGISTLWKKPRGKKTQYLHINFRSRRIHRVLPPPSLRLDSLSRCVQTRLALALLLTFYLEPLKIVILYF